MFAETKQNPLKVAGYKPATFVKHNFSQVISEDFSFSYKLSRLIFKEFRNICFQGIIIAVRAAS